MMVMKWRGSGGGEVVVAVGGGRWLGWLVMGRRCEGGLW